MKWLIVPILPLMISFSSPNALAQQSWQECQARVAPLIEETAENFYEQMLEKAAQGRKNSGSPDLLKLMAAQAAAVHVLSLSSVQPHMSDKTWKRCHVLREREEDRHRQERIDKQDREWQAIQNRVAREQEQKRQSCKSRGGEWKTVRFGGHRCSFEAKSRRKYEERQRLYQAKQAEEERKRQELREKARRVQEEHRQRVEQKRLKREQRRQELLRMQLGQ